MQSLVELGKGIIITDSKTISKHFGVKHHKVMEAIARVFKDYPDLSGKNDVPIVSNSSSLSALSGRNKTIEFIEIQEREYRGRKFEAAIMNREFFTLLMMRFDSSKAREWQRKFNAAFYEMERRLLQVDANKNDQQWQGIRSQTKLIRRTETDAIQKFVDYATDQGSENAKYYYKHLTNSTYKALGLIQHKQPKIRETLEAMELGWIISAEWVATQSLLKHMLTGEHYKAIFILVKQDIEKFAEGLMLPKIESQKR
jgi:phage regulator Rha-like protein